MTNDIQLYLNKETIGVSCSSEIDNPDKLQVDIWCLDEKTKLPLVKEGTTERLLDAEGNQLFFECNSDLLRNSIFESTSKIIFDANHDLSTNIGTVDTLYLDNEDQPTKLGAQGFIENPYWVEAVKNNNYTGISVYGNLVNGLPEPTALNITRISFLDQKPGACDKERCFVKTAVAAEWDGSGAQKRLFEKFSNDADGTLNKSSLKKYFAIVDGDGSKKGDYSYPIGDVIDGTAKITKDGIWTAYNFAKREDEQNRHPGLVNKLIKIMKKEGIELPPSVKADNGETEEKVKESVLETETIISEEDKNKEVHTHTYEVDHIGHTHNKELYEKEPEENNNIKNIDNVNNNIDEDKLNKINEDDNMVKLSEEDRTFLADSISSAIKEGFETIAAGFKAEAPEEGPEGPNIEEHLATIEPVDFWSLAKENIGLNEKEFGQLKESAGQIPTLTEQLNGIQEQLLASNAIVEEFRKKELSDKFPAAFIEGVETVTETIDGKEVSKEVSKLDLLYQEYIKDSAKFTDKYLDVIADHRLNLKNVSVAAGSASSVMTPDIIKRNEELRRLRPHGK